MRSSRSLAFLLFTAGLALAGCSKDRGASAAHDTPAQAAAPAPAAAHAPAQDAKQIFATRCTPCHGAEGRGDGAASASLVPKPRNFHDPAWQSTVTDDYLAKIIQYGGAAVGKSPTMPANPDLGDPTVIAALASQVRELGKTP